MKRLYLLTFAMGVGLIVCAILTMAPVSYPPSTAPAISAIKNYTNSNPVTPDFSMSYNMFQTNAAFTLLPPKNIDTGGKLMQTTVVLVTNSTAAAVAITAPAKVHQQGTWFVTNVTSITFTCYGNIWTNAVALPLW